MFDAQQRRETVFDNEQALSTTNHTEPIDRDDELETIADAVRPLAHGNEPDDLLIHALPAPAKPPVSPTSSTASIPKHQPTRSSSTAGTTTPDPQSSPNSSSNSATLHPAKANPSMNSSANSVNGSINMTPSPSMNLTNLRIKTRSSMTSTISP